MVPRNSCENNARGTLKARTASQLHFIISSPILSADLPYDIRPENRFHPDQLPRSHGADLLAAFRTQVGMIGLAIFIPRADLLTSRRPQFLGLLDRKSTRLNSSHLVISY